MCDQRVGELSLLVAPGRLAGASNLIRDVSGLERRTRTDGAEAPAPATTL